MDIDPEPPDDGPSLAEQVRARIRAKPTINPPDWASWAFELDRLGGDIYGAGGVVGCWGEADARECLEDGLSPAQALESDMAYWDE